MTKAVHMWVGPAGAISLKADFGEVSLRSIQPGGGTLSRPARRRHAGAVPHSQWDYEEISSTALHNRFATRLLSDACEPRYLGRFG